MIKELQVLLSMINEDPHGNLSVIEGPSRSEKLAFLLVGDWDKSGLGYNLCIFLERKGYGGSILVTVNPERIAEIQVMLPLFDYVVYSPNHIRKDTEQVIQRCQMKKVVASKNFADEVWHYPSL